MRKKNGIEAKILQVCGGGGSLLTRCVSIAVFSSRGAIKGPCIGGPLIYEVEPLLI